MCLCVAQKALQQLHENEESDAESPPKAGLGSLRGRSSSRDPFEASARGLHTGSSKGSMLTLRAVAARSFHFPTCASENCKNPVLSMLPFFCCFGAFLFAFASRGEHVRCCVSAPGLWRGVRPGAPRGHTWVAWIQCPCGDGPPTFGRSRDSLPASCWLELGFSSSSRNS